MENTRIKFNGGIWSDALKGRYDLENYASACRTCENFVPTRYGHLNKRGGTKYLGAAKHADKQCVLFPFQFSVNTSFILEFGEYYVRFWSNDLQVESAPSTPLEVVSPYDESELYELQLRAINDIVYVVHPNHPVQKLTRIADDDWTMADADLTEPFVDPDKFDAVLTPSAVSGTGITITSDIDVFDTSYIDSVLRLKYLESGFSFTFKDKKANDIEPIVTFDEIAASGTYTVGNNVKKDQLTTFKVFRCIQDVTYAAWMTSTSYSVDDIVSEAGSLYVCLNDHNSGVFADDLANSEWLLINHPDDLPAYFAQGAIAMTPRSVSGEWNLKTSGIWRGTWLVQRSLDGGTSWVTIKSLVSDNDANFLVEEDEEGVEAQIRVLLGEYNDGGFQQQPVTFTVLDTSKYGTAKITGYTDAQTVTADVIDEIPLADGALSWQESAFCPRQGYPRTIALQDSRLILAGTNRKPQAFFYSALNDYNNFLPLNTLADSPFQIEVLSEDQSSSQWISAQKELFVGTASVEGALTSRKNDEAASAENPPVVKWNESMGSAHRPAIPMNDALACLQRGRRSINVLAYSLERDGYTGEEVTLLCPQLFDEGIAQLAHSREPYTSLYAVVEDGALCHMVYEPKLQVTSWCKFTTEGGSFESAAILPSPTTNEDMLWCAVKREVDGQTVRYIERFSIENGKNQRQDNADGLWYVDSGIEFTGSPVSSTLTGLDHLEGETVLVVAGYASETLVVNGGEVTTSLVADRIIVGLPIVSLFEPLDLESTGTFGKRKQLFQTRFMVEKSFGGQVAADEKDWVDIVYHTAGQPMDTVTLKDGYFELFHESSHGRQKYWKVRHADALPFTLQAVIQTVKVTKK